MKADRGVPLDAARFSPLHFRLWLLVALGSCFGVAGCCVLALAITALLRIEPKGRSLAELSEGEAELSGRELAELAPHPVPP